MLYLVCDTGLDYFYLLPPRLLSDNTNNFKSIESHLKKDIENLVKVKPDIE